MTAFAAIRETGPLSGRASLTAFLMEEAHKAGAQSYMLLSIQGADGQGEARLLASNWIYDAVEMAGSRLLASLVRGKLATVPGEPLRRLVTAEAPRMPDVLSGEDARLLHVLGHGELYSLVLHIGRHRLHLLLSAAESGSIRQALLPGLQMRCCYELSRAPHLLGTAEAVSPLSDRERECLVWVSQGKTTEEIALILGVSANTVNGYITHAVQKLSASNRVMAISKAIRSGII